MHSMTSIHTLDTAVEASNTTLIDVMYTVLDLLPSYVLEMWKSDGAGIRDLRLVSKEIGVIALRAVTSCKLTLAKWKKPDPVAVAVLVAGAQLETLELHIVTYPSEMTSSFECMFIGFQLFAARIDSQFEAHTVQ